MNDTAKHSLGFIASIAANVSSISLHQVNEFGSFACWIIGCLAGLCTIHSWAVSRRKRRQLREVETEEEEDL